MSPRAIRSGIIYGGLAWIAIGLIFAAVVTFTRAETLQDVNRRVNRAILYREYYGWDFTPADLSRPHPVGNCNTFAATKRAELIREGWAAARLVIWSVLSHGQRHSILVVDDRDALDVWSPWIERKSAYRLIGPVNLAAPWTSP